MKEEVCFGAVVGLDFFLCENKFLRLSGGDQIFAGRKNTLGGGSYP